MSQSEVPAGVLEQIRETERQAREAGDWVRRARDEMRICAGECEDLDRRSQGEPWYTGGLAEEARRLRELVSELDVIALNLDERGW